MKSHILIAEDDADDRLLLQQAFTQKQYPVDLQFAENGLEVMDRLAGDIDSMAFPNFIILDLNMPKMNGFEALKQIKRSDQLKKIPVIMFSTTNAEQDVRKCYESGANSYVVKPTNFAFLVEIVESIFQYWFRTASLV